MAQTCVGCLSIDRDVVHIFSTNLQQVYSDLLDNIPINSQLDVNICWECQHLMKKFKNFKNQVQNCHKILNNNYERTPQTNLSTDLNIISIDINNILNPQVNYKTNELEIKQEDDIPLSDFKKLNSNDSSISNDKNQYVEGEIFATQKKVKKKRKTAKKHKKKEITYNSDNNDTFDNDEFDADIKDEEVDNEPISDLTAHQSEQAYKEVNLSESEIIKEREEFIMSDSFKCSSNFKCELCMLCFKGQLQYDCHVEEVHSEAAGEYMCNLCESRFTDSHTLDNHMKFHKTRYECTKCQQRFILLDQIESHVKEHNVYKCDLCQHVSSSSTQHQSHMSKKHSISPTCVQCNKKFSSLKTFRHHMNVLHKGKNSYSCPHCDKVYQWNSNLLRHIKNHKASESGELYCSLCDKKFSSVATYKQHLETSRRHVDISDYAFTCEMCGAKFVSKYKLKDHMNWEHLNNTNYVCSVCNKPFKSRCSLYIHLRNVHRNTEDKDTLCHICGKSYLTSSKLKYHIAAIHSGVSQYKCNKCRATFNWYSSLYRHMRQVHTKEKQEKECKMEIEIGMTR